LDTRYSRVLVAIAALALLASSRPAVAATGVTARKVPGDARLGADESYVNPDVAWTLGARWERVVFQWSQIQPGGQSSWVDPAEPSMAQLQADRARGVDVVGLLINTPGWAQAQPSQGVHSPPAGLSLAFDDPGNNWGQFCASMAKRYAGVVSSWIIWNEPDVWDPTSPFFTWSGDAASYYQLLKVASQAIKAVAPEDQIVVAGTTFYWDANANHPQFVGQVLDAAAMDPTAAAHHDYFDAVAAHVYTTATNAYWVPRTFGTLLAKHEMHQPIWIDEMNVAPYDDAVAHLSAGAPNATLDQQAGFMLQAYAEARAAGVARIGVYKLQDVGLQDGAPFGLVRDDGSLRPAYAALQTAVAELASMPDAIMRTGQHHVAVAFPAGSRLITVVWNSGPSPYTLQLCALGATARVVDMFGNAQPITATGAAPGYFQVPLPPSAAHGMFNGRDLYYIGGAPRIVEEDDVSPSATCASAVARDGRYFAQTGYRVESDAFWSYFQARGGVTTFGYPISRTFRLLGFTTQLFQRQAMQLAPDGSVRLLNLLDAGLLPYTHFNGSAFPAADSTLQAAAPSPADPNYAAAIIPFVQSQAPDLWQRQSVRFFQTFQGAVRLDQAFPHGGGSSGLLPLLNLEVWGLPTSRPALDPSNHNFIYQRFQRGVMHFDSACTCTQGILFGDYLKEIITNQGLPPDVTNEALNSPLFRQYDPDSAGWLQRPEQLLHTDLTYAFERG